MAVPRTDVDHQRIRAGRCAGRDAGAAEARADHFPHDLLDDGPLQCWHCHIRIFQYLSKACVIFTESARTCQQLLAIPLPA
jgi:hypothetical protein